MSSNKEESPKNMDGEKEKSNSGAKSYISDGSRTTSPSKSGESSASHLTSRSGSSKGSVRSTRTLPMDESDYNEVLERLRPRSNSGKHYSPLRLGPRSGEVMADILRRAIEDSEQHKDDVSSQDYADMFVPASCVDNQGRPCGLVAHDCDGSKFRIRGSNSGSSSDTSSSESEPGKGNKSKLSAGRKKLSTMIRRNGPKKVKSKGKQGK